MKPWKSALKFFIDYLLSFNIAIISCIGNVYPLFIKYSCSVVNFLIAKWLEMKA